MILRNRDVAIFESSALGREAAARAVLALHRFGMGPRPGSIAAIEADPRGALIAELDIRPLSAVGGVRAAVERQGVSRGGRRECEAAGQGDRGQAGRKRQANSRWPDASAMMPREARRVPGEMAAEDRRRSRPRSGPADLSRGGEASHRGRARRRDRICRAAGLVLVQSFLHLGGQDPEHVRRL